VYISAATGGQKAGQWCPLGGHFEERQCHALAAWNAHRLVQKWFELTLVVVSLFFDFKI